MSILCPVCGATLAKKVDRCASCGTDVKEILVKLKKEKENLANVDFPKYSTAELDELFELVENGSGYGIVEYMGNDEKVFVPSRYKGRAVNAIKANAFEGSDVTKVYMPVSVRIIEHDAFAACYKLKSVLLPNKLQEIGAAAFMDCNSIAWLDIPDSVKEIGERAFSGCVSLYRIKMSENVEIIPSYCFENCSSLPYYVFGEKVKDVSSYAFLNCHKIKKIKFNEGLAHIGDFAFSGCYALERAILPESLVELADGAFYDCSSLSAAYVGEKTVALSGDCFYACNSLVKFKVSEKNARFYVDGNAIINRLGEVLTVGCKATVIPPQVVSIARAAFSGYSFEGSIEIPSTVRYMEGEAVFNNANFTIVADYPVKPEQWNDKWVVGDTTVVWKTK